MANVKFDRKTFEKEIGKLSSEMQEKIALFGTPVESLDENELELEIFPNRPDLLGYQGFKRSFLGFLGKNKHVKYKLNKPKEGYEVKVDSSVKNVRPYTVCAIVKGLKLNDSRIKEIVEIQEKLHSTVGRQRKKLAIGLYPMEKIALPITYKAMEPDKIKFQPLEGSKEMSGLEILQKHPTGKDYAHLLAGKMKFPVFVDNEENVLSMPPIINSEKTGRVTEKTRNVFIECSGFDLEILKKCLNILVTNLADMGGKIYQMKVDGLVTPELKYEKMNLSVEKANKVLGLNLTEKEVKNLLLKMGYTYEDGKVDVAPWRTDVLHEIDLIEDVAIAYGYENFTEEIPKISTIGGEEAESVVKRKIAEILTGLGLLEVSNYHLTKKDDEFSKMGLSEKDDDGLIALSNSKTEYNVLRKDLAHYVLSNISENSDSEYPQKIFELGRVFYLNQDKKVVEEERLSVGMAPGNFTDLRQVLDYLFFNLGLKLEVKESEGSNSIFVDGRVGDILLDGEKIGVIGEVHPKILKNWKIKMPLSLFEITLTKIFEKF